MGEPESPEPTSRGDSYNDRHRDSDSERGLKTMGAFLGTTVGNREDQRAIVSKHIPRAVFAKYLRLSSLEQFLPTVGNPAIHPLIRFLLLRRQVLYPPELRARVTSLPF